MTSLSEGVTRRAEELAALVREEVAELCRREGMPDSALRIAESLVPAVRLRGERARDIGAGQSRFGGMPDLPEEHDLLRNDEGAWIFLLQLRLEDLRGLPAAKLLPPAGLLSFFVASSLDRAKVVCISSSEPLRRLERPGGWRRWFGNGPRILPECRALVQPLMGLPDPFAFEGELNDEQVDFLIELEEHVARDLAPAGGHQMFGPPTWVQSCELEPDELLLLQLSSDATTGTRWGDLGRLYFLVKEDHLRGGDFSEVRVVFQTT